jgi:hypothetical protein
VGSYVVAGEDKKMVDLKLLFPLFLSMLAMKAIVTCKTNKNSLRHRFLSSMVCFLPSLLICFLPSDILFFFTVICYCGSGLVLTKHHKSKMWMLISANKREMKRSYWS